MILPADRRVWNEGLSIDARAYAADGGPLGDLIHLTDNGRYPRVIADGDRWLVGFHEVRGSVIGPLTMILDADGSPVSDATYVEGPVVGMSLHLARRPEGLVGAWASSDSLRFARLSDDLRPLDPPATVYSTGTLDGVSVFDMVAAPEGTVIAFHDVRRGAGGMVFVSAAHPSSGRLVEESSGFVYPRVALAADIAIGFEGGDHLRAERLWLR